jgi:hypothetical protein
LAQRYCPVVTTLHLSYYWSLMQVEYALDLVFKTPATLGAFYLHLRETLIHAVKPQDIATFLGKKLHGNYQGEVGNNLNTRIKHHMGAASIKMYDKTIPVHHQFQRQDVRLLAFLEDDMTDDLISRVAIISAELGVSFAGWWRAVWRG